MVEEEDNKPRGFDRGLQPERIIGATDSSGKGRGMVREGWRGQGKGKGKIKEVVKVDNKPRGFDR